MEALRDADEKLRRMAEIDILLADCKAARDAAVLDAETRYSEMAMPLADEQKGLINELERIYKSNRVAIEAKGARSVELIFGRIGYRKSTGLLSCMKGVKWPQVLAQVKERYKDNQAMLLKVIRTKESLIKDALKSQLKPEVLPELGLRVTYPERFFVETFPDRLKEAGKPAA